LAARESLSLLEWTLQKPILRRQAAHKGPLFGREAIVVKVLGRQLQVQVSSMTMALKLADLSPMVGNFEIQTARANKGRCLWEILQALKVGREGAEQ
jgi:hypothetical protein